MKYLLINPIRPKSWVEHFDSAGPIMTTNRDQALQLDYIDAVTMKKEIRKKGLIVFIEQA